ncbi:bacillithiol biosynthesis cysteine-adding enzyme BshC [Hufsiella ginkgonis]|uniref:Putative cysteine ligase BshC n=1 Tax=Hufsiella ginkgonis TaxID=2695274 RepID=A0A7K1Y179_9SPHI|nr:bacillithiol biosynthesis cysteine-adding enzyme BshC [Hufsiella ginkgonis]MXV17000.1 bacillithiol biosynthesis cysteine-adding enzyme BshC [Hufsiella ginkgonis]
MKSSCIDYRSTGSFSPAVIRYLNRDEKLEPFQAYPPTLAGLKAAAENRNFTGDRELLAKVLLEQYEKVAAAGRPAGEKVLANIRSLANENTFTVTTGHQLNIFTGPLYFIFKIVTAINLANQLKKADPGKHFVPVYWMATEDHDFAEINHTYVDGQLLSWETGAKGATGRMNTATMAGTLKSYTGMLGLSGHAADLAKLVTDAYTRNENLADATRYLVNALFGDYGLVVIDADDTRLKKRFAPVIAQDIFEQNSYRQITASSEALQQTGFQTQVNAREINFFYLADGLRERLVLENGTYYVLNSDVRFTPEELRHEISAHPERFSPNVILRPLYQEMILPNIAYVGGGAEIVYWLQLKKNFDFYDTRFPVLILRNSAMLADEEMAIKLTRLDLCFEDLFTNPVLLEKEWVRKHTKNDLSLTGEWAELEAVFEKISFRAAKVDPTLAPSAQAVKARLGRAIQNLEKKLVKAEKRNNHTALSQIAAIREKLFPQGGLQERKANFAPFYVKHGPELISELVKHLEPLDFKFTILS